MAGTTNHFNRINSLYIYINPTKKLPLLRVTHFTYKDYLYYIHFTYEEYLIYLIMTTYNGWWIRNDRIGFRECYWPGFLPFIHPGLIAPLLCALTYVGG